MSDYAITEVGGQPMTAWDYRSLYLRDGIRFDNFACPFCHIRLCANLIYKEEEGSKSPYFSAKWDEHIGGCNGEPFFTEKAKNQPSKAHYELREMYFPEALTDRPPPRITRQNEAQLIIPDISPVDIMERRRKSGLLGRAIPKTYLLQPIVEVYNGVWKDGFDQAKSHKWGDIKRISWTNDVLCEMPIRLADQTNYRDAFRTPAFLDKKYPRIYRGDGLVTFTQSGFIISSKAGAKINDVKTPFCVEIDGALANEASPKYHIAIFSDLNNHAENGTEVRWYAYGMPCIIDNLCKLRVLNLDYLYFKKAFQKQK
jgi:hypothetical protein